MTTKLQTAWVLLPTLLSFMATQTSAQQNLSWEPLPGPCGADVQSLSVGRDGGVLAGTTKGVYRSTDGGSSWHFIGHANRGITSSAADGTGRIYVGTDSAAIFRSENQGFPWIQVFPGREYESVQALKVNGAGDVFAAGRAALYRSTDNGESWSKILATCNRLELDRLGRLFVFGEETLYAGESCLRSTDNGATWTSIQPAGVRSTGPVAVGPDTSLYVMIDSTSPGPYSSTYFSLLRSDDGGDTWVRPDTGYRFQRLQGVAVDQMGNVFVATQSWWGIPSEVYISTDHGATWQTTHFETTGEVRVGPMAATQEGALLGGTNSGIARFSTVTGTWEMANLGLRNTYVEQLVISPSGTLFAGLQSQGLFRSDDDGEHWTLLHPDYWGYDAGIAFNSHGVVFLAHGIFLQRSTDNGDTWSVMDTRQYFEGARAIVIDSSDWMYVATDNGLLVSTDQGENWKFADGLAGIQIFSVGLASAEEILAGSYWGRIYRSTDHGKTWVLSHQGKTGPDGSPAIVSFAFSADGACFAGGEWGGMIYRSVNRISWDSVFIESMGRVTLLACPDGRILAGSSSGFRYHKGRLVSSSDGGKTWDACTNGLDFDQVRCLTLSRAGVVHLGTTGGGIFRSVGPLVSISPVTTPVPSDYSLSQNYPNPFNPTTRIRYSVGRVVAPSGVEGPGAINVRLTVYDLLGREVAVLVNEVRAPGTYEVQFSAQSGSASGGDAKGLASGVYLYRLTAGSLVETRKMLLVQ